MKALPKIENIAYFSCSSAEKDLAFQHAEDMAQLGWAVEIVNDGNCISVVTRDSFVREQQPCATH